MTPKRKRREEQLKLYREVTRPAIEERAGGMCEDCGAVGSTPHHINGRAGKLLNDETQIIFLCHPCHMKAHENLKESRPRHLEIVRGKCQSQC